MSSGVPRGGGKNQHSDNVNMASNDGKMQNLPRGGSKNQAGEHATMPTNDGKMANAVRAPPNNQYFGMGNVGPNDTTPANVSWGPRSGQFMDPPNEAMMHSHRMTQPHYAAVPVQPPPNPTIYSSGSFRQEGPGSYLLHVAPQVQNGPQMPAQANYGGYTVPNNYGQMHTSYNGGYYPQAPYGAYAAPHSQQQYVNQIPAAEAAPAQPPAPSVSRPRERKILAIVDPTTEQPVNIAPSKASSTSTTPNTTVDADKDSKEEVANKFRKDFSAQVKNKIESDSKKDTETQIQPVAHSEKKIEPAVENNDREVPPETESKEATPVPAAHEEIAADVQPAAAEMPAAVSNEKNIEPDSTPAADGPHVEQVEESAQAEEVAAESTPQPSVKPEDEVTSLRVTPPDAESSPSISVEQMPAVEEEEPALSPSPDQEDDNKMLEEEEAERIRQREIELDNLLEVLEKDSKECDESSGFYGRKFLYCVRDIEKEFKRTEPPVPLEALKNTYGIDIQSMPKTADKKRTDFTPSWVKNPLGQGPRKYPGRPSHEHRRGGGGGGGGGSKNKPFTGRASIERAPKVQLQNKAENAWKGDKLKPEDMEKEEVRVKILLKAVRALLNKITPTTKDDLIHEFLRLNVSGEPPSFNAPDGQVAQVVDIIFDKAVDEPKFCSLYSEICKRQVEFELKESKGRYSAFRNALLNRSQNTFVNKTMEADKAAIDNETDEEKKKEMMLKYEDDYNKFRRRKFGNITFIGQLYYQALLSTKIIQWCLFDLLRHSHPDADGKLPEPPYDEESLQCAAQLVEVVGQNFENSTDINGARPYLAQVFEHLVKIAPRCSPKIRFKILGVKELRQNNWVQRKIVEQGPKKITEIHKEIQAEQQQLIMERDAYERKQGQGVRQGSNSLRRNAPPPSRNSLDSRTNNTQNKRAVAGTASKLVPTNAGTPRQMSLSIGVTQKKANWKSGSGGGGNTEGPGSRTIIQRNSGSREGSESRKNSTMTDRDAALQAAREIGNPVNRSNSQLSVLSQEDIEKNEATEKERQEKIDKIPTKVENLLNELSRGEETELSVVDELFSLVSSERFGTPELRQIFQQFVRAYIDMKPPMRPSAAKILYQCLLRPGTKASIIKGIENYGHWAIEVEAWEDNPNLWELLADLLVRILLTVPETEDPEQDNSKKETMKATTLDDFSPIFLAASTDDRPNKTYALLILTLKQMAETLAKENVEMIAGIAMDFQELSCCKELDSAKLETALKRCNPDVPDFDNLYDLVNH